MDIKTRAVVTLAAVFAFGPKAFAERGFTDEFVSGETRPQSIALLPVEATITRAQVVETAGLIDESVVFGSQFNAEVAKLLADKGYEVQISTPTESMPILRCRSTSSTRSARMTR